MTRFLMGRWRRHLFAGLFLSMMPAMARAGDDWLTESEQKLFQALGASVTVDGKISRRAADLSLLPEIARQAPQPLRGRIETIAESFERMNVTPEEKAQYAAFIQNGQKEVQRQMRGAMIGMLLGRDSRAAAVDATNGIMKGANVTDAWELQRRWLERGLAARNAADAALDDITGDLERRLGRTRPGSDLALRLEIEGRQLAIGGTVADAAVGQPILQVKLFKRATNGQWTGLNLASGALAQAMGIDAMDMPAQAQGGRLAVAQERAMNLPMVSTVLLPSLKSGQHVRVALGVPATASAGIERVEARLWSGEGWFSVDRVPGLDEARQQAIRIAQNDRRNAIAARQQGRSNGPSGPMSSQARRGPSRTAPPPATGKARARRPIPSPSRAPADDRDGEEATAAPAKAQDPGGAGFAACRPGVVITLARPADGSRSHFFDTCVPAGKSYRATRKKLRLEFDGSRPLKAVAESPDAYVAIGRDTDTQATAMILVPRAAVAEVRRE